MIVFCHVIQCFAKMEMVDRMNRYRACAAKTLRSGGTFYEQITLRTETRDDFREPQRSGRVCLHIIT